PAGRRGHRLGVGGATAGSRGHSFRVGGGTARPRGSGLYRRGTPLPAWAPAPRATQATQRPALARRTYTARAAAYTAVTIGERRSHRVLGRLAGRALQPPSSVKKMGLKTIATTTR